MGNKHEIIENKYKAQLGRTMLSNRYSAKIAAVLLFLLSTEISAESARHHDPHQQDAHLHGLVEMTLAIENHSIELNLESPAANIVGFEHTASTPAQLASINRAKTVLGSPKQLLTFIGTHCKPTTQEIDISAVSPAATNRKKDAHQEHADHGTHSEISARYQFNCARGDKLTAINVHLFELFPRIETIHVAWVSERMQALTTLKADSITINFKDKP